MKKAIRVLAWIATILMVLSVILFAAMVVLQHNLAPLFTGMEIKEFVVPFGRTIYLMGLMMVMVLLLTTAGSHTVGIWAEIISAILIGVVLPPVQSVLMTAQNVALGTQSSEMLVAYSVVNNLTSYATLLVPVAAALALLACGMSLTYKRMIKKLH